MERRRRVRPLDIVLPGTSLLRRRSLRSPLRRCGRSLHCLLLIVLPHYGVPRLVTVVLAVKRLLLLHSRIPAPGILSLIERQRGRRWSGSAVPPVPSASTLRPFTAPVLTPAWRHIRPPPAKVRRGIPVVAHRDSQHEKRHNFRGHELPRPVVPGTHVPVIPLVYPVHAIVKEKVQRQSRSVVDRVTRH